MSTFPICQLELLFRFEDTEKVERALVSTVVNSDSEPDRAGGCNRPTHKKTKPKLDFMGLHSNGDPFRNEDLVLYAFHHRLPKKSGTKGLIDNFVRRINQEEKKKTVSATLLQGVFWWEGEKRYRMRKQRFITGHRRPTWTNDVCIGHAQAEAYSVYFFPSFRDLFIQCRWNPLLSQAYPHGRLATIGNITNILNKKMKGGGTALTVANSVSSLLKGNSSAQLF